MASRRCASARPARAPAALDPGRRRARGADARGARRLAAQLARTEEASKRALVASDRGAKGGVAGRLLAAERELARAAAERADAQSARPRRPRRLARPPPVRPPAYAPACAPARPGSAAQARAAAAQAGRPGRARAPVRPASDGARAGRAGRAAKERKAGAEARARARELAGRLEGALRDQRRLAAQLGQVQAGSGRLALRGALAAAPPPARPARPRCPGPAHACACLTRALA